MRNLKKILALVLALVMSLSLVTMANADFSDAADIEHKEAVEVMAAAGVLAGSDGKFDPNGTLTRAQAAKIIAYVLTGGEPAAVTGAPFSDVPASHWAAAPIAYVAGKGIVDGLGDGSFNPNGQLTGYAFGKMLLNALKIEGTYTGLGWEVNVAEALEDEELLTNLDDVTLGNALSREHAAQLALNAMKYTGSESVYRIMVDGKPVDFDNEKDALLYCAVAEGTYVGEVKNTEGSLIDEVFEIEVDTGVDAYGRVATTYDHEDWAVTMAYGAEADYTYVVDEDTTVKDLVSDKNLGKKITSGVPENYVLRAGSVVELYVNDEKALTNVVSYLYVVAEIESVEELDEDDYEDEIADGAKYMIEAAGEEMLDIQIANFDEKTYVEGAMIMVPVVYTITGAEDAFYPTYDKNFAEIGTEWVVVDTEINEGFEGKVERKGSDYVRVDGTKYVMSNNTQDAIALGAEGTFYTDANDFVIGFVAAKDAAATIDDVVYLVTSWEKEESDKYNSKTKTTYAQVIDLEGNVEELVVAIDNPSGTDYGVAPDAEDYGHLYTYATYTAKKVIDGVDYKGTSKLTLWEPEDVEEGEDPDFYLGNINGITLTSDKTKAGNYRLNNSTVYILIEGSKSALPTPNAD